METLFTTFLLFLAAIVALLTYLIVPTMPAVVLMSAAAIGLAAGVWWHWTQFAIDYRTSTWQEQLRNYASYALLLVVILLSYAFYVFAWSGSSLQSLALPTVFRNIGQKASSIARNATNAIANSPAAALSAITEPEDVEEGGNVFAAPATPAPASNRRNANFLFG
jgi:hypothetical protein